MTIGLVMDFFNPKLLEGAQAYCSEQGLLLDARWSVRGDWIPKKLTWDGVIYGLVDQAAVLERMRGESMPALDLVADGGDGGEISLIPDYFICGQLAVNELVRSGVKYLLIPKLTERMMDQNFTRGAIESAKNSELEYRSIQTKIEFRELVKHM